jgi:hypothetical protein
MNVKQATQLDKSIRLDASVPLASNHGNMVQKKKKARPHPSRYTHDVLVKHLLLGFAIRFASSVRPLPQTFDQLLRSDNLKRTRSLVREVLGTQEPVVRLRTGVTALTTTGAGNLLGTINCDISGVQHWASWVTLFDEYKLVTAKLHIVPWTMPCMTTFATTPATTIPTLFVVDYDDATPPTAVSDLLAYDSQKLFYLGSHNPKTHMVHAQFQGIPDFSWTTTATPVIPAYFKYATFVGSPFLTLGVADIYIEFEVRFRQTV